MKVLAVACAVWIVIAPTSAAAEDRKPMSAPQVLAAMRAQALDAGRRHSIGPMPVLSSQRVTRWPVRGMRHIPWRDAALRVSGDLWDAGGFPPGLFARGRSVGYGPQLRSANALGVGICTDAAAIDVLQKGTGPNSELTVFVEGARVNAVPAQFPSDGRLYATRIDFGAAGRRCLRFLFNDPQFGGFLVGPSDRVWAPGRAHDVRVMFLGDSYTESGRSWAAAAAQMLGWDDAWLSGVGGTGYVAAPEGKLNFAARFQADVAAYRPDVLVIAGGINDGDVPPYALRSAATALFDRIRRELPAAVVFVLGPWNPRSAVDPAINAAIRKAAAGRANVYWVPNYDDRWITGTGRAGAPTGDGNSDILIGEDGTHPTPEGHRYLAQRFAEHMREVLGVAR